MELSAVVDEDDLMAVARVVEGRLASHAKIQPAAGHGDPADHLAARRSEPGILAYRHEIDQLGRRSRLEKAGDEHIGIGPVELLAASAVVVDRSDLKETAFLVVENRCEHTRRVEP